MASSSRTATPGEAATNNNPKMDADLDAIGRHCQMEYCGIKTFLPYICNSCKEWHCEEHRLESSHKCKRMGEAARKQTGIDTVNTANRPKPSIYDYDKQCGALTCKKMLDSLTPHEHCENCGGDYCYPHRFGHLHDCENVKKQRKAQNASKLEEQKEKGLSALKGFRAWANKKAAAANSASSTIKQKAAPKPNARATNQAAINALKMSAKGDAKIPTEKRVYVHVEASADTTKAKYPTGKFFYNKEWSIGRILDVAASALQVQNVNNRVPGEDERLRVFHVEKGQLLNFSDKAGAVLEHGNTIVLLRGVGPPAPDLITL